MELTPLILKAQVFSLEKHRYKDYGKGVPYAVHVIFVVSIIQKYLHLLPGEDQEKAICGGWLHDTREDNGISYNEILKIFGFDIAEITYCLTNEDGRTRKEKAIKTYPKTAQNRLAVFVKLADRIANTSYSKMNGSDKFEQYASEFDYFKQILYIPNEYEQMWIDLAEIAGKEFTPFQLKKAVV